MNPTAANAAEPRNPFIGPDPFKPGQRLFGRDREARRLFETLVAERIVLLHSPSGAGKTSLVQAGLLPRLEANNFHALPVIRVNLPAAGTLDSTLPGPRPNRYLFSTITALEAGVPEKRRLLAGEIAKLATLTTRVAVAAGPAASDPDIGLPEGGLAAYLRKQWPGEKGKRRVLIFDQFEEVLTARLTDRRAKREFFIDVGEALADTELWALFAIREEYLAALKPYARWMPTALATTFRLDLLTPDAAKAAIQKPVEAARATFDPVGLDNLVGQLSAASTRPVEGEPADPEDGGYVEPVHLQVVCHTLWEGVRKRSDPPTTITAADVEQFGKVPEALQTYYRTKVEQVAAKPGTTELAIREWFDKKLITVDNVKRQVSYGEDGSEGLNKDVVKALLDAHLVREEVRGTSMWLELAHDRLIAPIRKDNDEWRKKKLQPLQQRALLYAQKPADSLCLKGPELEEAERWAAENSAQLTDPDRQFLDACRARQASRAADRTREKTKTLTLALAVAVVVIVGMGVVVLVVNAARARARDHENAAKESARKEASERENAQKQQHLAESRGEVLKKLFNLTTWVIQAQDIDRAAAVNPGYGVVLGRDGLVNLKTDADALEKLSSSDPRIRKTLTRARVTERALHLEVNNYLHQHRQTDQVDGFGGDVNAVAFGPGGLFAAVGTGSDEARPCGADAGGLGVVGVVGPDGKYKCLAAIPRAMSPAQGHTASLLSVAFHPRDRLLATGEDQPADPPWAAVGGTLAATRPTDESDERPTARVVVWAVTNDGQLLKRAVLPGHKDGVTALAFSPDGQTLVSGGGERDKSILLWDTKTWQPWNPPLMALDDGVAGLAFHPNGTELAAGGKSGKVVAWKWTGAGSGNTPPARDPPGGTATLPLPPGGRYKVSAEGVSCISYGPVVPGDSVEPVLLTGGGTENGGVVYRWQRPPSSAAADGVLEASALYTTSPAINCPSAVRGLASDPTGRYLAAAARDYRLYVWEWPRGTGQAALLYQLVGHAHIVTSVAFHPDAVVPILASGSDDRTARLWTLKVDPDLPDLHTPDYGPRPEAISPTLTGFAKVDADARDFRYWDFARGRAATSTLADGPGGRLRGPVVTVHPDTGAVAIAGERGLTVIRNAADPINVKPWPSVPDVPVRPVNSPLVAIGPTGRIAVTDRYNTVAVSDDGFNSTRSVSRRTVFNAASVLALAVRADGGVVVLNSRGLFLLWDGTADGEAVEIGFLPTGASPGTTVCGFSPDGRRVAVAARPVAGPTGYAVPVAVYAVPQNRQEAVSESVGSTVPLAALAAAVGLPAGAPAVVGANSPARHITFSHDGRYLAVVRSDSTVEVRERVEGAGAPADATWRVVFAIPTPRPFPYPSPPREYQHPYPTRVSMCAATRRVAVGYSDGSARVWAWSAEGGTTVAGLPLPRHDHLTAVTDVAFNEAGDRLVTGAADGTVLEYQVNLHPALVLAPPVVRVRGVLPIVDLVVSGNGETTLTLDEGGRVRAWACDGAGRLVMRPGGEADCKTRPVRPDRSRRFRNNWIDANADGTVVAVVGHDNTVEVLELAAGRPAAHRLTVPAEWAEGESVDIRAVALSEKGNFLAVARQSEYVRVYRVGSAVNQGEREIDGGAIRHDSKLVNYVAFCPNDGPNPRLASAGADGTIRVWRVVDDLGKESRVIPPRATDAVGPKGLATGFTRVGFNLSGTRLVTIGSDKLVRVWDLSTDPPGAEVGTLSLPGLIPLNVALGDGDRVMITTTDNTHGAFIHRVTTYELNRTKLLDLTDKRKRFLPTLTPEMRKEYFPGEEQFDHP